MFAEDFPRRPMGCLVAIKRDGPRQSALALERPPEKGFGCRDIALGAEHKIDRLSLFVDRTIEVSPAAFDLYVGFIDPPGGASSACEAVLVRTAKARRQDIWLLRRPGGARLLI